MRLDTPPNGDRYGRVLTGTLAVTVTVSYGVLMYAFPVMLMPMQVETGWSRGMLTGGFSAAALAAGVAAIPIGRSIDRYGARVVMTAGSLLGALLMLAWSRVQHPVEYLLIWIGLGVCMAALFYEPAFAAVTQWCGTRRARALALITLAGGLASTIFVPVASALVESHGWRGAVARLGFALGVATVLPHALLLRGRPAWLPQPGGARDAPAAAPRRTPVAGLWRTRGFAWIGLCLFLAALMNFAVAVHLVAVLIERGATSHAAAASLALLGLAKLPGRLLVARIAGRIPARVTLAWLFGVQALALVALGTVHGDPGVWLFIILFGAGDGASTPARAELVAELFGAAEYGRVGGVLAFVSALGRAAGPIGATLARSALGGYGAVMWLLAAVACAAALALARVPGTDVVHGCVLLRRRPSTSVSSTSIS